MASFWKHLGSIWKPNQYCPIVIWKNWDWFSGDFTLVMVQYIVYRDYRDKPSRDNYIVTITIIVI